MDIWAVSDARTVDIIARRPRFLWKKVLESTPDSSTILLNLNGSEYQATINLPGGYNIYNATATAAAGYVLGIKNETIIDALSSFECGFGRMEKFTVNGTDIRMILIKKSGGLQSSAEFFK